MRIKDTRSRAQSATKFSSITLTPTSGKISRKRIRSLILSCEILRLCFSCQFSLPLSELLQSTFARPPLTYRKNRSACRLSFFFDGASSRFSIWENDHTEYFIFSEKVPTNRKSKYAFWARAIVYCCIIDVGRQRLIPKSTCVSVYGNEKHRHPGRCLQEIALC